MTLAVINKARKGDVAAFKELMDSGYGKNQEIVKNEISVFKPLELTQEQIDAYIDKL